MIDLNWLYKTLFINLGPSGWWPADSKREIILGAILVQNTNWSNADKALQNLKAKTHLDPQKILSFSQAKLMKIIRSSGFYKNKSKAILATFQWFNKRNWKYKQIWKTNKKCLRTQILSLPGIGQETADTFLLYIFNQPVFIADSYTRRLFQHLGYQNTNSYTQLKKQVKLPNNFSYLKAQDFHGLIDNFGKKYLRNNLQFTHSFLATKLDHKFQ